LRFFILKIQDILRMHWLALIQNTHSQVEEALTWANVDIKQG